MFDKAREYGKRFCYISFDRRYTYGAALYSGACCYDILFVLSETAKQYPIMMLCSAVFMCLHTSINTIVVCGVFPAGGDSRYDAISVFLLPGAFCPAAGAPGDIRV